MTAFDSTGSVNKAELSGRRSAVEADGVVPQTGTRKGKSVWVVPNPYRGFGTLADRPSAWDLTPNAYRSHGDAHRFHGPAARALHDQDLHGLRRPGCRDPQLDDPVNESIRPNITDDSGTSRPGVQRQQDNPNDGQASWNLISRNGQDVVSGIYLFAVESSEGTQRGKFVIIR